MRGMTVENIVRVCAGTFSGDTALLKSEVTAVTTDSRQVTRGCLFAAIAGERVDGHRFINNAFAGGALCALGERVPENAAGPVVAVPNVPLALQDLAAYYRGLFSIPVVGITGSVGKTTAKEMIASVLSQKTCVHKTLGNFNNELGVPLTLFGLRPEHGAAVVEMGISHFGEMRRLTRMVRPDFVVFTVIGHAHLEFLGDREGVLRAKSEILEGIPPTGTVFLNGDDDLLRGLKCAQRRVTFGRGEDCDVRAVDLRALDGGRTACAIVSGDRRIEVEIQAFGDHMVYAALEGAAVGMAMGLGDEEIRRGISAFEPVGHRARIIVTGRLTIIDDCYNANPTSVASAIYSMGRLGGRKVCILGDMLELGADSARLHREIGALAVSSGVSLVLAQGEMARSICDGAGKAAVHFETREELIAALGSYIRPGDTVLVKASHSMKFEEISEALEKF